jgi:chromate transporter
VRGTAAQEGAEDAPAEAPGRPASPAALFRVFSGMALQGFGGVLPVAQRVLVDQQRWMTPAQFLETLSVSQVLPGPNVVNLSLIVGDRFFGWRGAAAALAGMLAAPLLIVLTLAALHARFAEWPAVAGALRGMGAVSAGLVLASGLKLMPPLRRSPMGLGTALVGVAATTLVVGLWRVPLVWAVLGLGGVGMAWAWWRLAHGASPKGGRP